MPPPGKVKVTVLMDAQVAERLRRTVWWSPGSHSLSSLLDLGCENVLRTLEAPAVRLRHPDTGELIEKPAGEPFPPRTSDLHRGPR